MNASRLLRSLALLSLLAATARADLDPAWISTVPAGSALGAGIQDMVTDAAGISYVTGNTGPSSNTDTLTAAIAPDGTVLWSHAFNGAVNWHDQARGIALGPDGKVWVVGNTPAATKHSNVLLLAYDAASGALLQTIQYSSGVNIAEYGSSVVVDGAGNVYVGGGTVGDGGDCLMLKFDPTGQLVWTVTWDGAAWSPYSQDEVLQVDLDPTDQPIFLVYGVMASLHPDYVVLKLAPADGSIVWEASWGGTGEDWPVDMVQDAVGDIFVTGMGRNVTNQFSTIKLRGSDGQLLWQAFDKAGIDDIARAVALDGQGGVYITGSVDPDGDQSNTNDDIYTIKRDAATGAQIWTHYYGDPCKGCFDSPSDVIVDPAGNVFVAGTTRSAPYSGHVLVLALDAVTGLERQRGALQGAGTGILQFDGAYNLYDGGRTYDVNTGAVEISVFRIDSQATGFPTVYCVSRTSSCGATPSLWAPSASASLSGGPGSFDVTCAPVPSGSRPGLVIYTTHGAAAAPVATPYGWLCIQSGGLHRVLPPSYPSGTGCAATYTVDLGGYLAAQGTDPELVVGATMDLQMWYRDPLNSGGANLSNAMVITLAP